jgi:hypothetical protein
VLGVQLPALLAARAVQAASAAWLTRVAGRSFITYFRQDQDWGDGGLEAVLQRQYDLSRREGVMRKFLDAALRRVVEPLREGGARSLPPRPERARSRVPRGEGGAGGRGRPEP